MKHRINNQRFSIRFCHIAQTYGYSTVGAFERVLRKAQPNAKWSFGTSHRRGSQLLKEIDDFRSELQD